MLGAGQRFPVFPELPVPCVQGEEPDKAGNEQFLMHLGSAGVTGRREMVQERMLPTHPPVSPGLLTSIPAPGLLPRGWAVPGCCQLLVGAWLSFCCLFPSQGHFLEKSQPGAADPILRKAGKPSSPTLSREDPEACVSFQDRRLCFPRPPSLGPFLAHTHQGVEDPCAAPWCCKDAGCARTSQDSQDDPVPSALLKGNGNLGPLKLS